MALWLLTTPMVGIYNIIEHYPSIFKAFSPYYIYRFFQKNGKQGWQMLGGIVLCITGMGYRADFSFNFIPTITCNHAHYLIFFLFEENRMYCIYTGV